MVKKRGGPHGRTIAKSKRSVAPAKPVDPAAFPEHKEEITPTVPAISVPIASPASGTRQSVLRSAARSAALGRPIRRAGGLSTDYRYVVSDLKRIGILAGGTFAVLVGLAFVIK